MAKPIGTLGTIDSLTVGGRVFTDISSLIILQGTGIKSTGDNVTMRKAGAAAGYSVTAAKTYTIYALTMNTPRAAAAGEIALLYNDNDCGINTATAFTTPKYYDTVGTTTFGMGAQTKTEFNIYFAVPATKFVSFLNVSAGGIHNVHVFGYET